METKEREREKSINKTRHTRTHIEDVVPLGGLCQAPPWIAVRANPGETDSRALLFPRETPRRRRHH